MGYYTDYDLSVSFSNDSVLKRIVDEELIDENFNYTDGDSELCLHSKWYDHKKDMLRISAMFPGVLFTLSGEGEEAGDMWREYYRDGKMQRADVIITIEQFDESKLK